MTAKLFFQAIFKFLLGVFLVGLLIFLPAGTLSYFNGWLLMTILFVPMFGAGIVMMIRTPALLEKRLRAKETIRQQDLVVKLTGLMFVVGFVVAGLDVRFEWIVLPQGVSIFFAAVFLAAYLLYAEVLRENAYLSRTIEVQEHQTVVSTGLYGIVRHPMYAATLLLFLSMPLVLGSVCSLFVFLCYPVLIVLRIRSEEKFLAKKLRGYRAYQKHVKYRLIPFLW